MRAIKNVMMTVMAIVAGTMLCAGLASAAGLNGMKKTGIDIDVCLVDVDGMTLYIYKKDSPGKSTCGAANGCLEKWPVFYLDELEPAIGFNPTDFAVITREDGKKQTTYKGMPLYYYSKDKTADDTLGQGVDNAWYVAVP
jgi:predicted lipoprotein with Yx(FWY)xxD motif